MKKYRVNVNGTVYDITLEVLEGEAAKAPAPAPAAAPRLLLLLLPLPLLLPWPAARALTRPCPATSSL